MHQGKNYHDRWKLRLNVVLLHLNPHDTYIKREIVNLDEFIYRTKDWRITKLLTSSAHLTEKEIGAQTKKHSIEKVDRIITSHLEASTFDSLKWWRGVLIYDQLSKNIEEMSYPPDHQRIMKRFFEHKSLTCCLRCIEEYNDVVDKKDLLTKCVTLLNRCPGELKFYYQNTLFENTNTLAIHLTEEIIKSFPNRGIDQSYYLLASIYYRNGDFIAALRNYEKAILSNKNQKVYQIQYKKVLEQLELYKNNLQTILGDNSEEVSFRNETAHQKWSKFCVLHSITN
ncbi:ATP-dependent helicase/nuclease subunit A [Acrasis kona]|uniref:ATP-dependent helicase/nuclease subunit A n=1 Tax=Acrasis kona TaxID=1008807 RepID=A0AAW2Z968_9EUKA